MRPAWIALTTAAVLYNAGQATAADDGKAVYDKACAACHKMMSPKLTGDKAKWDVILKAGRDQAVAAVVKGKGAMPAKGGAKSDAEAKAAAEYMLTQIK